MFKITDIIFNYSRKVNQHSPQVTKKKLLKLTWSLKASIILKKFIIEIILGFKSKIVFCRKKMCNFFLKSLFCLETCLSQRYRV